MKKTGIFQRIFSTCFQTHRTSRKDSKDKIDICPSDEETLENNLQLSSGKDKVPSDSDSSYDMLQQGNDNNNMDDNNSLEMITITWMIITH